jgi:hypothetical protein
MQMKTYVVEEQLLHFEPDMWKTISLPFRSFDAAKECLESLLFATSRQLRIVEIVYTQLEGTEKC